MKKSILTALLLTSTGWNASAFNELTCAAQAKMLAEAIALSQVGSAYSSYTVEKTEEKKTSRFDREFAYRARNPLNNDSMTLFIKLKFSDFGEGTAEAQKQCYLNGIEVQGAG